MGAAGAGRERRRRRRGRWARGRVQDRVAQSSLRRRAVPGRRDRGGRDPARRVHDGRAPDRDARFAALWIVGRAARAAPLCGRGQGRRRLRELCGRADRGRRGRVRSSVRGEPARQRDVCGAPPRGRVDPRGRRGDRESDPGRGRAHGARRDSRCVVRLRGPVGSHGSQAAARAGRRSVHRKAPPRSLAGADRVGGHRRDPGHGRGGAHVVERRDGRARGRGRDDRRHARASPRERDDAVRDPAQRVAGADARCREAGGAKMPCAPCWRSGTLPPP